MTRVLVSGGNGALGREVVKQLVERGYTVRIMSRHGQPAKLVAGTEWAQADLELGQGVAEKVRAPVVIIVKQFFLERSKDRIVVCRNNFPCLDNNFS